MPSNHISISPCLGDCSQTFSHFTQAEDQRVAFDLIVRIPAPSCDPFAGIVHDVIDIVQFFVLGIVAVRHGLQNAAALLSEGFEVMSEMIAVIGALIGLFGNAG